MDKECRPLLAGEGGAAVTPIAAHFSTGGSFALDPPAVEEVLARWREGRDVGFVAPHVRDRNRVMEYVSTKTLQRTADSTVLLLASPHLLNRNDRARWQELLAQSGYPGNVEIIENAGRHGPPIDVLSHHRMVLMSPETVHNWLLPELTRGPVRTFLKHLALMIVNQTESFYGVYGSHTAYVMRRLLHARDALAGDATLFQILATCSGTSPLGAPFEELFGKRLSTVNARQFETSRHRLEFSVWSVQDPHDPYRQFHHAVHTLMQTPGHPRFIAAACDPTYTSCADFVTADSGFGETVLEFRNGHEETDRQRIQQAISADTLQGIVSTSFLSLDIDVPELALALVFGPPRIHKFRNMHASALDPAVPGHVVLVNLPESESVALQVAESAHTVNTLDLENPYIQYTHTLCFSAQGGEYDALLRRDKAPSQPGPLVSRVQWPTSFHRLFKEERIGGVPALLRPMRSAAAADPWHFFSLHEVGQPWTVEQRGAGEFGHLGTMSFLELFHHAYPGAILRIAQRSYRVIGIGFGAHRVIVRPDKFLEISPIVDSSRVVPACADVRDIPTGRGRSGEFPLYISQSIKGYREERSDGAQFFSYPCPYWPRPRFARQILTTGILLFHPLLTGPMADRLATLWHQAFLMHNPVDPSAIGYGYGQLTCQTENHPFIALYDQIQGSLRMTAPMLSANFFEDVLALTRALGQEQDQREPELLDPNLYAILRAAMHAGPGRSWEGKLRKPLEVSGDLKPDGDQILVIAPGGTGVLAAMGHEEFTVEKVFNHPEQGMMYLGRRASQNNSSAFPLNRVIPITGVSRMAYYDVMTGLVEKIRD